MKRIIQRIRIIQPSISFSLKSISSSYSKVGEQASTISPIKPLSKQFKNHSHVLRFLLCASEYPQQAKKNGMTMLIHIITLFIMAIFTSSPQTTNWSYSTMFIDIESGLPSMPLVSIAKRSYKHTDRQPTYMSCSVPCLYFLRLAISTSVRHFLLFHKTLPPKWLCKDTANSAVLQRISDVCVHYLLIFHIQ